MIIIALVIISKRKLQVVARPKINEKCTDVTISRTLDVRQVTIIA